MTFLKNFPAVFLLGIFLTLLNSCVKTETQEPVVAQGPSYFALRVGKSLTYHTDSILFDPSSGVVKRDTTYWEIRENFTDTFKNISGETVYRIERWQRRRTGQDSTWREAGVFSAFESDKKAIRTEGHLRYIKFPFLLAEKLSWNGNVFNNDTARINIKGQDLELFVKTWTFSVQGLGKPEKIGNKNYDQILTVKSEIDPRILTEKRYTLEKYAPNVGLVFKEEFILNTQELVENKTWHQKGQKGYIMRQQLVN
jgi:hypothetical protein